MIRIFEGDLFKNKNFMLYLLTVWISFIGDTIFIVVITWMLIEQSESALVVGTYLFIIGVTKLIFILFGGVVVDRINPKKLLIYSDVLRGTIIFLFFIYCLNNEPQVWLFYIVGLSFGIVSSISEPATISCRNRLVDKKYYTQSISLLMVAGTATEIIGPMIGVILINLGGTLIAVLGNGITFLISAILLSFIKFLPMETDEVLANKNFFEDFSEGIKYFLGTPIILLMASLAFFSNAAYTAAMVSVPFFSIDLGQGVEGFGIIKSALGIGAAVAAIFFTILSIKKPTPKMAVLACLIQGVFILFIGISNVFWIILIFFVIIGFSESAVNIIAPSVNHSIIPRPIFGRVLSVMILVMSSSVPAAQLLSGWAIDATSSKLIFIFGGSLEIGIAILLLSIPLVRNYNK